VKKVRLTTNTAEGNEGDIIDLDDTTADIYIREGMATTDFEEEKSVKKGTPTEEKIGSSEGEGPMWSERIVIQRNTENQDGRNIKINLWPPSESHPEYGPTLELVESRNVNGEWQDKRIRLTKGPKTLFLSELIKEGWKKLREHS